MILFKKYKDDVLPKDAWQILQKDKGSILVDVRTMPEWIFAGVPNLTSLKKEVMFCSWREYPDMGVNENFAKQILSEVADKKTNIFFICKTGVRSKDAANVMAKEGFKNCYNIINGFEGDKNNLCQRSSVNGWKFSGLPWQQN